MEGLEEVLRLGRRGEIGLGDDLDQRHAAAVEVDQAGPGQRAAARGLVEELAGVFLEVEAVEADGEVVVGERQAAAAGQRAVVLADLVALGEVGVEVVLPREHGGLLDLAAEGQGELDGEVDGATVEEREGAGIAEADGADEGVGVGAEAVGAAAEELGGGGELDVDFQADDRFEGGGGHRELV